MPELWTADLGVAWLTVRDAAKVLGVHENTIRNWETRGILRALHLPGSGFRRFLKGEVLGLRDHMTATLVRHGDQPEQAAGASAPGDDEKRRASVAPPGEL